MAKRPPSKPIKGKVKTKLLDQPPVRKAIPKTAGRALNNDKIKVSAQLKKPTEAAKRAAKANKKAIVKPVPPPIDPRLLGKNGRPLVGAALKMRLDKIRATGARPPESPPLDKNGRPLAGNALRMWQMKKDREYAAAREHAIRNLKITAPQEETDPIGVAAAASIQQQLAGDLDPEEQHRLRQMELRDRMRMAKFNIRVRARKAAEKQQQMAEQAQMENTAQSMRERVEEWRINRGDNYAASDYETEVADTATALDNWTGPIVQSPADIEHPSAPSSAPRRRSKRGWRPSSWQARGYPKPWEDPEQVALMEEAGVPPDSPTTNPRQRDEKITQSEIEAAEKISEVIGDKIEEVIETKRSKRKVEDAEAPDDPEHVIIEPKDNKELFNGLDNIGNVGQDLADTMSEQFKQEERHRRRAELDRKRKASRDDDFGMPSGFRNAAAIAAAGPKQLLSEVGNVLKSLVGVGGILGTLWAVRENFDRAPRVMNSITKGFKGLMASAYDLVGMHDEADALRAEADAIQDKDLASGKDAAVVGGTVAGASLFTRPGRWLAGKLMRGGWRAGGSLLGRAATLARANPWVAGAMAMFHTEDLGGPERADGTRSDEMPLAMPMRTPQQLEADFNSTDPKRREYAARVRVAQKYWDDKNRTYTVDKDAFDAEVRALLRGDDTSGWNSARASSGAGNFSISQGQRDLMSGTYQAFRKAGLSHEGALAHTAEIGREGAFLGKNVFGSHVDPANGATNVGFMSWQGSRGKALMARLQSKGMLNSDGSIIPSQAALDEMAQFSVDEMANGSKDQQATLEYLKRDNISSNRAMDMLGENHIKWRINDPKYRASGIRNRTGYYNEASKLMGQGTMQQIPNEVTPFQSKESVQPQQDWNQMKRDMGLSATPFPSNRGEMPSLSSSYIDDMLLVGINGGLIT